MLKNEKIKCPHELGWPGNKDRNQVAWQIIIGNTDDQLNNQMPGGNANKVT